MAIIEKRRVREDWYSKLLNEFQKVYSEEFFVRFKDRTTVGHQKIK